MQQTNYHPYIHRSWVTLFISLSCTCLVKREILVPTSLALTVLPEDSPKVTVLPIELSRLHFQERSIA